MSQEEKKRNRGFFETEFYHHLKKRDEELPKKKKVSLDYDEVLNDNKVEYQKTLHSIKKWATIISSYFILSVILLFILFYFVALIINSYFPDTFNLTDTSEIIQNVFSFLFGVLFTALIEIIWRKNK